MSKRLVSSLLAAALVLGAPGLPAYQAAAQSIRSIPAASPAAGAPVAAAASHLGLGVAPFFASSVAPAPPAGLRSFSAAPSAAPVAPAAVSAAVRAAAPVPTAAAVAAPIRAVVSSPAPALVGRASASVSDARAGVVGEKAVPSADAEAESGAVLFDQSSVHAAAALPVAGAAHDGDGAGLKPSDAAAQPAAESARPPAPETKTKLPRSLWGLFWGHHIMTVFGINFHMLSQPFLVMETLKKSKSLMGVVRNVHMGSMSIVNLLPVGYLIDKTDFRVLFIGTTLMRAVLMGSIPLLFLTGHLSFAALVAIVAVNPIFQSTMIVADGAARKAFLGKDEKLNKEAAATMGKWDSLAGMIMPLTAGWAIGALVASYGLGGYAFAYGVYAALLLAAAPFYWLMVRDPRDHSEMGMSGFKSFMAETGKFVFMLGKGLLLSPYAVLRALWNAVRSGRKAGPVAAPGEKAGVKERMARALDRHEATKGLAYILRNKTLSTLMSVGAIEAFLSDAMPMVVLPNYITDAVGTAPGHIPLIGSLLATSGGIFGVMLAAEYVGRFISSSRLEGDKGDRLIEKVGHGRFYRMAALSSLLFWLMWAFPALVAPGMFWVNLGVVLFVQFAMQLMHAPVGIVMAPVVRKEIPDDKLGRVDSAFNMVDLFFSAGGALAAGLILDAVGIKTAMFLIACAITVSAGLEWMVPKWIFPDGERPAKDEPKT